MASRYAPVTEPAGMRPDDVNGGYPQVKVSIHRLVHSEKAMSTGLSTG
jgi:hypothetical protein